jgi:hypothetical protein
MVVKRTAKSPTVFQVNRDDKYRMIKMANVKPKTSIRNGAQIDAVPELLMKLKNMKRNRNNAGG